MDRLTIEGIELLSHQDARRIEGGKAKRQTDPPDFEIRLPIEPIIIGPIELA